MRLATNELPFLYGNVLRALGLPYGALGAAIRMVVWAEVFHGLGVIGLDRQRRRNARLEPRSPSILSEGDQGIAIDAAGDSALLLGPAALDLACAKADAHGSATISLTGLRDLLWLGQLPRQAAKRGLACALSFQCPPDAAETADLEALYSAGRTVLALPGEPTPLWIELPVAAGRHENLFARGSDAEETWPSDFLERAETNPTGVTLSVARPKTVDAKGLAQRLRAEAQSLDLKEPKAVAALERKALQEGVEVPESIYYPLARYGLTTLVAASEDSRAQAGADG